jgi:5'(3')-deoxyribonucleotidase
MCPKWKPEQVEDAFMNPRLFDLMQPFPGAVKLLEYLVGKGDPVTICTVHRAEGVYYKSRWIHNNIPFIKSVVYIENGGKMDKSMIFGDVIIDDNPKNLASANTKMKICCGDYGWNKDWGGIKIDSLRDIYVIEPFIRNSIHDDKGRRSYNV